MSVDAWLAGVAKVSTLYRSIRRAAGTGPKGASRFPHNGLYWRPFALRDRRLGATTHDGLKLHVRCRT